MTRTSVLIAGLFTAALGAMLWGPTSLAEAHQPDPPVPTTGPAKCNVDIVAVVCTIEVPVPVPTPSGDRALELLHLSIAAGLGATIGAMATVTWVRRPRPPLVNLPVGDLPFDAEDVIDITDVVQPRPARLGSRPT